MNQANKIDIAFDYFPSMHLTQIYFGFFLLHQKGLINLRVNKSQSKNSSPLLKVLVNNNITVVYDTLDGFNWIFGTLEENLIHFNNNIQADFYFKRSFHQLIKDNAPVNCKVYPLGLNFSPKDIFNQKTFKQWMKILLAKNDIISNVFKLDLDGFDSKCYLEKPTLPDNIRIFFFAGLWNPDDVESEILKTEREVINKNRVNYIRRCKVEFGNAFTGGIQDTEFARKYAPDLILPFNVTKRTSFLKLVKSHAICIATTGLHNSIGWKFAEFVAASRAVVSEPLNYELPGNFEINKNYLAFKNESELLHALHSLRNDRNFLLSMMKNNDDYYNAFVEPSQLVLNSLEKVLNS